MHPLLSLPTLFALTYFLSQTCHLLAEGASHMIGFDPESLANGLVAVAEKPPLKDVACPRVHPTHQLFYQYLPIYRIRRVSERREVTVPMLFNLTSSIVFLQFRQDEVLENPE